MAAAIECVPTAAWQTNNIAFIQNFSTAKFYLIESEKLKATYNVLSTATSL
jgi:hypothetical protein